MAAINDTIKMMAVTGIKQGGKALVEAVCKELSTDQLQSMLESIKKELDNRVHAAKPV